jgi:hypothetical protein
MKELFVLVFGSSIDGTVLYGSFNTPSEVHDANRQLALPFYTVGSISIDETNEELTKELLENPELYTIAVGDPFVSMTLKGLFTTRELAYDKASTLGTDWYIVTIKKLEKVLEEIKQSSGLAAGY